MENVARSPTSRAPETPIPTGTVAFLFSDIASSTKRWEQDPDGMRIRLLEHDRLLRMVVEDHRGYVFKMVGDQCCAAFARARDALQAAVRIQRSLSEADWNQHQSLQVRIALHAGAADERGGDYFGPPVNRVSRLVSAARSGQIIMSAAIRELVFESLPEGVTLTDLGSHRLKDLLELEHVFQVKVYGIDVHQGDLLTLDAKRTNLPIQVTSFVGRREQVSRIGKLLRESEVRLVTVTGSGGVGKSRLAIQLGAEVAQDFPDGVYFVELAPVSEPAQVITAIRSTLAVSEGPDGELEPVIDWFGEKRLLLIVDNFEHVLGAAPALINILGRCPQLKILVTSRVLLRVAGEHAYALSPMETPGDSGPVSAESAGKFEAVRLFVQRARAVRYDFELTDANAGDIAGICQHVDALPLAVELAAARVKIFDPHELLERLTAGRGVLSVLTTGTRGAPSRHESLRSAIEWSFGLLPKETQDLLVRLSVFRGGFTFEAAEAICGFDGSDILDGLEALLESSLLQERSTDGRSRYSMLETVREFGESQIEPAESQEVADRHAEYFLQLSEQLALFRQTAVNQSLDRLEEDHENLLTAIDRHLKRGRRKRASKLAANMGSLWIERGYTAEGMRVASRAAPQIGTELPEDAPLLAVLAYLHGHAGRLEESAQNAQTAEHLARASGDDATLSAALAALGHVASYSEDLEAADRYYRESENSAVRAHDRRRAALAGVSLAQVLTRRGDSEGAMAAYSRAVDEFREVGYHSGVAISLIEIGNLQLKASSLSQAEESFMTAQQAAEQGKSPMVSAIARSRVGTVLLRRGDLPRAAELLQDVIAYFRTQNYIDWLLDTATYMGVVMAESGSVGSAVRLWSAVNAAGDRSGNRISEDVRMECAEDVESARRQLSSSWPMEWESGSKMTLDEAVELALQWQMPNGDGV